METDTFPREDVKKFFSRIVVAKVDANKDQKNFKAHQGKGVPLLLLMDPAGKVWVSCPGKPPDLLGKIASELWNPGVALSNEGKTAEAFDYWGRLVEILPEHELATQARGSISQWESDPALKAQMDEKRALWRCEPAIKQAEALIKKKKHEDARALLDPVVADFPGTSWATKAQELLAKLPAPK